MTASAPRRPGDRLAAGFLLIVLALGCLTLLIGIPVGFLWVLSRLTDSFAAHFIGGLLGIPLVMALFAPVLFWINGLYLRVTVDLSDENEWDETSERPRLRRGGSS